MQIKIYRVADNTWYDASDYVVDAKDIPIYERNIDWSPVISTSNISVSFLFPETISANDKVQLYFDNTHYYNYIIRDVQYDYPKRVYDLTIEKHIGILKDMKLNRVNLHSALTNTSDTGSYWVSSADANYEKVKVTWAIKCMFSVNNLNLDITDVDDVVVGTANYIGFETEHEPYFPKTMHLYDVKMDVRMLYLQGFNYAGNDTGWNDNGWKSISPDDEQRLSMWDFITEFCMHMGLMIYNHQGDNYKLISKNSLTTYSPSDFVLIDKKQKKYYKKNPGAFYECYSAPGFDFHTDGDLWRDADDVYEVYSPARNGVVHTMPKNFRFLTGVNFFASSNYNPVYWQMYSVPYNGYGINMDNWGDSQTKDYTKYTYTTEIQNTIPQNDILTMSINLKDRTTEIETIVFD